jgi:hypothetical protein
VNWAGIFGLNWSVIFGWNRSQVGWNWSQMGRLFWLELKSNGLVRLDRDGAAFKLSGIIGLNWSEMGWNIWIEPERNIWMEQESSWLELESNG